MSTQLFAQYGPGYGISDAIFLCGLLVFGPPVSAGMLKAAVLFHNTKSRVAVPQPSFLKAIGIILVGVPAGVVASFCVGGIVSVFKHIIDKASTGSMLVNILVSIPVGLLVLALVLQKMLPTTFRPAAVLTIVWALQIGAALGCAALVIGPGG